MFNYDADQIFVIHPADCGGGILSLIFSLDDQCASLNFKNKTQNEKIHDWQNFTTSHTNTAHLYNMVNINSDGYWANIENADSCSKYVHKGQFYCLDEQNKQKKLRLLNQFSKPVKSVGIYITESCVDNLNKIRNTKLDEYHHYKSWIYSNQTPLLKDFFNITCVHTFSFSELLDKNLALDHINYCKDLLDLNFDNTTAESFLVDWYHKVLHIDKNKK